jgi:protein-L-isoaspartate O-methyltransferase
VGKTENFAVPRQRTGADVHLDDHPGDKGRLVFASFLMLFVELALIRWTSANNVYLRTATNFVLLASFLGIGLGFLNARSGWDYLRWTPVAFLALVGFVLAFPVILQSLSGPRPYRGLQGMPALPHPVSLSVIFVLTVAVMAGFGQAVSRTFIRFEPLAAYRLDVVGSIAGIAAFSALSFLDLPPLAWGVIAAGGLAALLGRSARWWQLAAACGVVALLGMDSFAPHEQWSPYYKISVERTGTSAPALYVTANNVPYQAARSLAVLREQKAFYFYPYRHVARASLHNVLVIGAGLGNDVTVALSEGARHIDAVEIDPVLLQIGRELNPARPYQNPRVTAHVADGRQYLQDSPQRYNLILFALPDSQTALPGQSNLRLEGYLLTIQSVAQARSHLAPGGTFSMYNYYNSFSEARFATTIEQVFHRVPCLDVGPPLGGRRLAVLTVRSGGPVPGCADFWRGRSVAPATDDHPFPYLENPTIPATDLRMLGLILAAAVLFVRVGGGSFTRMRGYLDLACMGAAFLLLETMYIVQFALLFGSTWFVNSLVFAAVLVAVYLAVETASRVMLPPPAVLYGALFAALTLAWVIPEESLLGLPPVVRFLAGSALAFAPVFLANLVFAERFSGARAPATAFAASLLGAIVGGALEYVSLITGHRFLLILAGALYALAFVAARGRISRARPA